MSFKVFGDSVSGNCHKIRYVADLLGLTYEWQEVNILEGESRTPEYLSMSPQGQVPVVQLEDGTVITQSNGIMRYLARGSALFPSDPLQQAKVDEWLFWEQYSHEPYVAVSRFQMRYLKRTIDERDDWRVERGNNALDFMDACLANNAWLANESFSIADIALYAYTSLAHEGGFSLEDRPNVERWVRACHAKLDAG
jgi:glutathione S-transferase